MTYMILCRLQVSGILYCETVQGSTTMLTNNGYNLPTVLLTGLTQFILTFNAWIHTCRIRQCDQLYYCWASEFQTSSIHISCLILGIHIHHISMYMYCPKTLYNCGYNIFLTQIQNSTTCLENLSTSTRIYFTTFSTFFFSR